MGFLFSEPKIQGDELRKCLAYYEQELKFKVFQEKEADLYNNALIKYGRSISTDSRAAKEVRQAANRLAQSASEILERRGKMTSIPDAASAMYFAWQLTYSDYSAWATAQSAAIEAVTNGLEPHGERVRELLSQSEKSRHEAENEEKKLIKRLKLSGGEVQKLFSNASAAITAENWQPEPEEVLEENAETIPRKINEIYKQVEKGKQEALLRVNKVFEGLDERDKQLLIAANIGIIPPPARLSTRLGTYRSIVDELHGLVAREGVSPIDNKLEAERILVEQTWWGDFVKKWKEKWSIYNEDDIGAWGYGHKKLQPYIYEFGYFYQTPADYKNSGPFKPTMSVEHAGPRRFVSWRIDIKSSDVIPIKPPVSDQLEKGLVLVSMGNNEQAIVEFNRYIEVRPNDPIAYEVRGDAYYDTGQFDKAIDNYSTSIKLEPKLAEAYDKRAIAYAELGDFEKSIKDITKAIELYPENAEYYFNRSITHDKSGNIDKAIDDCTKAIELEKNYAKAFYNRGMAYSEKGEYDKAIFDFDKAISLKPDFMSDVYFNRAIAYQRRGENAKALADYKRVLELISSPEDIEVVNRKISELTEGDK